MKLEVLAWTTACILACAAPASAEPHAFAGGPGSHANLSGRSTQAVPLHVRYFIAGPPARYPPPPPPPMPPPPPAPKSFVVFFDFDKSTLSPQARAIIAEAVHNAQQRHAVRIVVTGHTDTVGSGAYNHGLSERRALSVKVEMVADGLPVGEIDTVGRGFADPLVPTGPGVREPQNRRAVIQLGGTTS